MQSNIYVVIGVVVFLLFELFIIYDLFKVIKLKNYTKLWIPATIDTILFMVISILIYIVLNMPMAPTNYRSTVFTKMYLLQGRVQLLVTTFLFIRIALIPKFKIKK